MTEPVSSTTYDADLLNDDWSIPDDDCSIPDNSGDMGVDELTPDHKPMLEPQTPTKDDDRLTLNMAEAIFDDSKKDKQVAVERVYGIISTYKRHLKTLKDDSLDESKTVELNQIYDYLHRGLSLFGRTNRTNLASRELKTNKRKIDDSDKQRRFVKKPKRGRKPRKNRDLTMPDTPKKQMLESKLLETPKKQSKI